MSFLGKKVVIKACDRDIVIEGGLIRIASLDGENYNFPDLLQDTLDAVRTCGWRVDLFTFLQRLPDTEPRFDYPMEWENLAVLPISTFDDWWTKQIRFRARNHARQADKKGVVVRAVPFDDMLLEAICRIYNESPIRQGRRFPHYGMTLEKARAYAGTYLDRTVYLGAFLRDEIIGFAKIVADDKGRQADLVHILSMLRYRTCAPTNALIAGAVRCCAERGIAYLLYSRFHYGKKRGDGLSSFKAENGFRRVDLPRYYVPLTRIGKMGLRGGLHHSLVDRVPEPLLAIVREQRSRWYNRKSSASIDHS